MSTGSITVRTNGRGQLTTTLLILVPDLLGPRDAVAKGYHVFAPFLVVPSSSEPGGDDADPIYRTEGP
jgi:hypothetical protein